MQFLNPMGLLTLLAIPLIIVLHFYKNKYKEKTVSSLYIWNRVLDAYDTTSSWQKFRKNLLMVLQIVAIVLLSLAISKPYLINQAAGRTHLIYVLDASMSMQATDYAPTRFEAAKERLYSLVRQADKDCAVSIVLMQAAPYIAVNQSQDKQEILNKIESFTGTLSIRNTAETAILVEALLAEHEGAVTVLTDNGLSFPDGLAYETLLFASGYENMAISDVSCIADAGQMAVLVKVTNYGFNARSNQIALYTDNLLYDVKDVTIEGGAAADVFFTGVPMDGVKITANFLNDDLLPQDDIFYTTTPVSDSQKVLMVSNGNMFLERVLGILPGATLYKSNAIPESLWDYDLCVFDGVIPNDMPSSTHRLILNPPAQSVWAEGDTIPVSGMQAVLSSDSALQSAVKNLSFDIAGAKELAVPEWGTVLFTSDQTPLIYFGEEAGIKTVIIGFDLHDTDLPLKKEFPILMYQIWRYFFPELFARNLSGNAALLCGEAIFFETLPGAVAASVVSPGGAVTDIAPPYPSVAYMDTDEAGFYYLNQTLLEGGSPIIRAFGINASRMQSDLKPVAATTSGQLPAPVIADTENSHIFYQSIVFLLILLLLALFVVEWQVYLHEY